MNLMQSITLPAWTAQFKVATSKCERCDRSLVLRHSSVRKAGIKMQNRWYCSSRCFAAAAQEELSALVMSSRPVKSNHITRMPLGLILMRRGLLTNAQFKELRVEEKEAGAEIGELLIRQGSVSEKDLTAVRATQWGCPVYTVPKNGEDAGLHIPSTFIHLYSMIPLHYVAAKNLLLVGFVHGIEYALLYAIERITGSKTQPCFVTPSDFLEQVQQRAQAEDQLGEDAPTEVKFDSVQSTAEMARILSSYSVHLEADEAVIGKCKEYLWARLKCGPRDVDLLFKAG
jgi:hypothetical protein